MDKNATLQDGLNLMLSQMDDLNAQRRAILADWNYIDINGPEYRKIKRQITGLEEAIFLFKNFAYDEPVPPQNVQTSQVETDPSGR